MGKKMEKGVQLVINKPVLQRLLKRHRAKFCKEGQRASLENLWNYIREKHGVEASYKAIAHYTGSNPSEWKATYMALIVMELESSVSELFLFQKVDEDGKLKYDLFKENEATVNDGLPFGQYDRRSLSASLYTPTTG